MIDLFNLHKIEQLEKRLKAVETYIVDRDIEKKNNEKQMPFVTLSDDKEGEPWKT